MWTNPVTILDDENEEDLISSYVRLSVMYPEHSPFEIAQEVFRDKPDSALRANQAGLVWGNRLDIKERIRKLKLKGANGPEVYTKEDWLAEILSLARDTAMTAREKREKNNALKLYGDGQGWIAKPVDAPKDNNRIKVPIIMFKEYQTDD